MNIDLITDPSAKLRVLTQHLIKSSSALNFFTEYHPSIVCFSTEDTILNVACDLDESSLSNVFHDLDKKVGSKYKTSTVVNKILANSDIRRVTLDACHQVHTEFPSMMRTNIDKFKTVNVLCNQIMWERLNKSGGAILQFDCSPNRLTVYIDVGIPDDTLIAITGSGGYYRYSLSSHGNSTTGFFYAETHVDLDTDNIRIVKVNPNEND